MSVEKLRNGRYRVRWRDATGRQRAKNFAYKKAAEVYERELLAGKIPPEEMPRTLAPTFAAFAERWLVEYCDVFKAPSERVRNRRVLAVHILPRWGEVRINRLTLVDGTALRAELAKTRKPASVNNVLKLAKKMLADAVDWDLLPKSPFAKLRRLPNPEQPFDYWMPEERDRFLAFARTADPDLHDLACVAVHTGLRIGELLGLHWDCIDLDRKTIMVKRSKCQTTGILREQTKSGRFREVPMNQVVAEVMRQRRGLGKAGDQPAFLVDHPRNTSTRLRRLARRAGVKPIRFHDLRHTFASLLAMAGVDLALIRELLGHGCYSQTLRYAHLHPSRMTGATEKLCTPLRTNR